MLALSSTVDNGQEVSSVRAQDKPLVYDLYCGLGGWTEAFIEEGYRAVGFDIERHDYGSGGYPGELVLQDILTLHGAQLKDADVIVASPPCQEFSYRAMPWKRAKAMPPPFLGMELFWACWRIQHEASEAVGRYIPMIVENVRGAQKWVGEARWNFGSFYFWGDVPALMPYTIGGRKLPGNNSARLWSERRAQRLCDADIRSAFYTRSSGSLGRKQASAAIAKIPGPLSSYIARTFKP